MKCAYCQNEIERGTGIMYVRRMGAIRFYCSNRCYKFDAVYHKKPRLKEIRKGNK